MCLCHIQVLYSLQGPVLWLGVRRSLQTGGWQHQVSNMLINTIIIQAFFMEKEILTSGSRKNKDVINKKR